MINISGNSELTIEETDIKNITGVNSINSDSSKKFEISGLFVSKISSI